MVEPIEMVLIDVPEEFVGVVMRSWEDVRRADQYAAPEKGYTRMEFRIPPRSHRLQV
jgi:predicted membrane GTPase involved in stress response